MVNRWGNKGNSDRKSYGFSSSHIWMWELGHKKNWTLRNWCFWTVVLERTFESPLVCKGSNESILKEISPEYSLEGLMLKLKLQYFGHLIRWTDSLEKTLMLGKIEGKRRKVWQRMRWLDGNHWLDEHEFEQATGVCDGQGSLACCSPWGHKELDRTEWLNCSGVWLWQRR